MVRRARRGLLGGGTCLFVAGIGAGALPAAARCADWDPGGSISRYGPRAPTARDLIELVDIGVPDSEAAGGPSPIGVSPDGRFAAIVLQRADLDTNGYCQALELVDLSGKQPPRVLDRGGDFIMTSVPFRGIDYANGFPRPNIARWSADGRSIAYLKRLGSVSRVWLANADGGARPLTPSDADVSRWSWGVDGRSLLYAAPAGRAAAEAAIDREGVTGWHYDERFDPGLALRPQITAPLAEAEFAIDPATGAGLSLSAGDHLRLAQGDDPPLAVARVNAEGVSVWTAPAGPSPFAPSLLRARDARGQTIACDNAACSGKFLGLWAEEGGRGFTLLRKEGWHERYTALYRWTPGAAPHLLLRTDDLLHGCTASGATLLCLREGAVQPPRLVAIDRLTGAQRVLFDPNPGFAALRLGRVQRLEWTNAIGHKVYGDLVLPSEYKGGRLPVVVVQYWSRGFLRGGTGGDYPIQLLSQRGFAVLSIDKPDMAAVDAPNIVTWDDVTRANNNNWAERRNTFSAIDKGLDLLVARGIADPRRLALTGLSDGGSSVRFAVINSDRFAAVATSSCCIDEASDALIGPGWEAYSTSVGYPPAWPVDTAFWKPYSFALNAGRIRTPILMQLADSETLMGLHAFTALKAGGAPVDLYVFPDEFHIKWQPQHRAAVWDRALDWFSFWLQGREDSAPAKAAQFERWRALRDGPARR